MHCCLLLTHIHVYDEQLDKPGYYGEIKSDGKTHFDVHSQEVMLDASYERFIGSC